MHKDVAHSGKTYRVVWEDVTIAHPEGEMAIVVDLAEPKNILWHQTCPPKETVYMLNSADRFIAGL
jgi:hypothetical protein